MTRIACSRERRGDRVARAINTTISARGRTAATPAARPAFATFGALELSASKASADQVASSPPMGIVGRLGPRWYVISHFRWTKGSARPATTTTIAARLTTRSTPSTAIGGGARSFFDEGAPGGNATRAEVRSRDASTPTSEARMPARGCATKKPWTLSGGTALMSRFTMAKRHDAAVTLTSDHLPNRLRPLSRDAARPRRPTSAQTPKTSAFLRKGQNPTRSQIPNPSENSPSPQAPR